MTENTTENEKSEDTKTIEKLDEELYNIDTERRNQVKRHREYVDAATKKATAEADAIFGASIRESTTKYNMIRDKLNTERDRIRLEKTLIDTKHPPVGTMLVNWATERFGRKWNKTGIVGVVSVWEKNSESPSNKYVPFSVGDKYIRIFKKDGTPSLRFDRIGSSDWQIEGVDPNDRYNKSNV